MDDVVSERLLDQLFADPDDQEEAVERHYSGGSVYFATQVHDREPYRNPGFESHDQIREMGREILAKDLNVVFVSPPRGFEIETESSSMEAMFEEARFPRHRALEPSSMLSGSLKSGRIVSKHVLRGLSEPLQQFSARVSQLLDEREAAELASALEEALESARPSEPHPALDGLKLESLSLSDRLAATTKAVGRRLAFEREEIAAAWTPEQVAEQIGVSLETLNEMRENGKILAIESEPGRWHYPRWQFGDQSSADLLDGLAEVLEELKLMSPLSRIAWLRSSKPALEGRSPLEALREGERDTVQLLARSTRGLGG